ncbi:DNA-directed RNA polymerase III subunit RPC7-like [Panonychus citri]|uniref:DNA-directed RNA polymerase III subunit RPC7-like n=1 Tax=Panonychus citri TaxID=50023 RepID=UPI0023075549|nr:DNA-directed RNA polymerase III subunit RPC7-like [Panonychus citri]
MSRGRGRGGRGYTFNLESIGIGKGEQLPGPSLAPPPLYPNLPVKPAPIIPARGDNINYLYDVKQSMMSSFRSSKYYLVPPKVKLTVQRYSDKFDVTNNPTSSQDLNSLDWRLFPEELKPSKKAKKVKAKKILEVGDLNQILKKREEEEENGEKSPKSEKDASEPEDEVDSDEGEKDEEDIEEDTDYARSYFDNGEGFLEESDDNLDEGPVY